MLLSGSVGLVRNPFGFHYAGAVGAEKALSYYKGTEDAEPDVFHYNFNGISGSFYIDKALDGGQVRQLTPDGLKITYSKAGGSPTGELDSFTITTSSGVRYHFAEKETTNFSSIHLGGMTYNSAWMLSSIQLPFSSQIISFSYENYNLSYVASVTEVIDVWISSSGIPGASDQHTVRQNTTTVTCKRLLTIDFGNEEKVLFRYNTNRTDLPGDKRLDAIEWSSNPIRGFRLGYGSEGGRMILISVQEFSGQESLTPYSFEYNGNLPERLAKSQDFWGFHNGKANSTLVPKLETFEAPTFTGRGGSPALIANAGDRRPDAEAVKAGALSSVTYPLGGRTDFEYEIHRTSDDTKLPYRDYSTTQTLLTGLESQQFKTFEIWENQKSGDAPFTFRFRDYPHGIDNTYTFKFEVKNNTGSVTYASAVFDYSHHNGGEFIVSNTQDMPPGTYRVYWSTNYPSQIQDPFTFNLLFNQWVINSASLNDQQVGGLRIKSVSDYDQSETKVSERTYQYVQADGQTSSGKVFHTPVYSYHHRYKKHVEDQMARTVSDPDTTPGILEQEPPEEDIENTSSLIQYRFFTKASYPMYSSAYLSGGHIGYLRVVEKEVSQNGGNNGETHYLYEIGSTNYSDNLYPYAPMEHLPWTNGRLKEKNYFNSGGSPVRKESWTYLKGGSSLLSVEGIKLGIDLFNGDSESGHLYAQARFFLPRGYSVPQTYTVTGYDGSTSITTFEEYEYQTETAFAHFKPIKSTVTKSDGSTEITRTLYPGDYTDTSGPIGDMKSNYLIGIPIEEVIYRLAGGQESVISGTITLPKSGGKGLSDKVLTWESADPVPVPGFKLSNRSTGQVPPAGSPAAYGPDARYRAVMSYDSYDEKGNLLQATGSDKVPVSYIWAYNGTYPIAKIDNASLPTVDNAILAAGTNRASLSNETNSTTIRTHLNQIRNNGNLSSALVSSYTYKPMVGMTSFTDPSGKETWYNYDPFGRLADIRSISSSGAIRASYCYNYAGQTVPCITLAPTGSIAATSLFLIPDETSSPLPVSLVDFRAEKAENNALLTWTTASEQTGDRFEIERSRDAAGWQTIGNVAAAGEHNGQVSYRYTDQGPGRGLQFYRLKMIDKDGRFEHGPIRSIEFDGETILYPNPVTVSGTLNLLIEDLSVITDIRVYGAEGRLKLTSKAARSVDIQGLVPGLYVVLVTYTDGSVTTHRIVKQ